MLLFESLDPCGCCVQISCSGFRAFDLTHPVFLFNLVVLEDYRAAAINRLLFFQGEQKPAHTRNAHFFNGFFSRCTAAENPVS